MGLALWSAATSRLSSERLRANWRGMSVLPRTSGPALPANLSCSSRVSPTVHIVFFGGVLETMMGIVLNLLSDFEILRLSEQNLSSVQEVYPMPLTFRPGFHSHRVFLVSHQPHELLCLGNRPVVGVPNTTIRLRLVVAWNIQCELASHKCVTQIMMPKRWWCILLVSCIRCATRSLSMSNLLKSN